MHPNAYNYVQPSNSNVFALAPGNAEVEPAWACKSPMQCPHSLTRIRDTMSNLYINKDRCSHGSLWNPMAIRRVKA